MTPDLTPAVKTLYAAFRRRGRAPVPRGCPCCTTPAEFEHLASKPLQHLTADDLDRYARKAMTTVGHADVFRYFLPRIVELAVDGSLLVDREVVFGKLRYGKWHEWPLYEQEALEGFARTLAATFATTVYDPRELDEWVCALARFVDDMTETVGPLTSRTPAARENLQALIDHNTDSLGRVELANAFWDEDNPHRDWFIDWLGRPDVRGAAA